MAQRHNGLANAFNANRFYTHHKDLGLEWTMHKALGLNHTSWCTPSQTVIRHSLVEYKDNASR